MDSKKNTKIKEKKVKINVTITSKQYNFIVKNKIDIDNLLKTALKLKKQKKLQEERKLRTKKFDNEFKKIKSKIDEYIIKKQINDLLWLTRYKHAKTLTRSHFIRYGGPQSDKLYDLFINNYTLLLKEGK